MSQIDLALAERLIFRRLAHDMNNCLTMIGHTCELAKLKNEPEFYPGALERVEAISKRIEAIQGAIRHLQYGEHFRKKRGDLFELLLNTFRHLTHSSEIDLSIRFKKPDGSFEIETDFLRFEQLLTHCFLGLRREGLSKAVVRWQPAESISGEALTLLIQGQTEHSSAGSGCGNPYFKAAAVMAHSLGIGFELSRAEQAVLVKCSLSNLLPKRISTCF